jgi:hypothetical protein
MLLLGVVTHATAENKINIPRNKLRAFIFLVLIEYKSAY